MMSYSDIAEVMGCSEFAAQKLFYRAKGSLKKQLIRRGLGRGSLMIALTMYGRLTAPTKAAAASVSVTSATVKVSPHPVTMAPHIVMLPREARGTWCGEHGATPAPEVAQEPVSSPAGEGP